MVKRTEASVTSATASTVGRKRAAFMEKPPNSSLLVMASPATPAM